MPILDVAATRTVMVIKQEMSTGFAGVDDELYRPRTSQRKGPVVATHHSPWTESPTCSWMEVEQVQSARTADDQRVAIGRPGAC